MNNYNDSIEELNILMDEYLEADDFVFQILRKEKKDMNRFKRILKHTTKAATVAALVLLAGGTVSAAVMHNNGVNIFKYGLSAGGGEVTVEANTELKSEFENVKLPETSDDKITNKKNIKGGPEDAWIEKNMWNEEYSGWSSDDRKVWEEYPQANQYTEYKYKDYRTAVMDVGFKNVLKRDYTGGATYTECEYLTEDEESRSIDYSIFGEFEFSDGKFTLNQKKLEDVSNTECIVITGETTNNSREYVSSNGYVYKLTDDKEFGEKRTTVLAVIGQYELILEFMGMSEDEIHAVLEDIDTSVQ